LRTDDLKEEILKMFRGNELYGYDINKNLAIQGIEVDLSRLYGVLNNMRKEGLLQERWEKSSSGPRKKMYSVTEKGREKLTDILLEAISTVHSFYNDYLVGLLPEINVFGDFFGLITDQMEDNENVAYLTKTFLKVHELVLGFLQSKNPGGKTFVVKPRKLDIVTNLSNLSILDGTYNDLPFKTGFIDRLIMIDLPVMDLLEDSVAEWQRVISDNGRVVIITPSILIEKEVHPMTIGDFVEKHEHEVHEGGSQIERSVLFPILNEKFDNLQETSISHMSIITTDNNP
jgi:DNA-binding PadR family transcriptional regulator